MFGIVRRKSRGQLVREELSQSVEHFKQAATHAARGTGATVGPKISAARDRVQPAAGRVKGAASSGWGSTVAALAPLAAAASDASRQADKQGKKAEKARDKNVKQLQKKSDVLQRKTNKAMGRKQSKPTSKLTGLLVVGAAVGAGAAYVARRRKSQQWDEYDPSRPIAATEPVASESSLSGAFTPTDAAFEPATTSETTAYGETAYGTESVSTFGEPTIPVGDEKADQTSSPLHSPTVARMAGGTKES